MKNNSVYVILHCFGNTEEELENNIIINEGMVEEIYFKKDEAEKRAEEYNNIVSYIYELYGNIYFNKYVVFEKTVY